MRSFLKRKRGKAAAAVFVLAIVGYSAVWIYKIEERRTYGLLETALEYGGIEDHEFRSYGTRPGRCRGPDRERQPTGFMTAGIKSGDGLEVAATIADRYEQEGWTVKRFISSINFETGQGRIRGFIATTDERSLQGDFDVGSVQLGIRTGPCLTGHVSGALQVETFERDQAGEDRVFELLDTAMEYGSIDGPGNRFSASLPKESRCDGSAYQANTVVKFDLRRRLETAEEVAGRYELEGWKVQRYSDNPPDEVRSIIATTDERSLKMTFSSTTAILNARAGPCIIRHNISDLGNNIEPVDQWKQFG